MNILVQFTVFFAIFIKNFQKNELKNIKKLKKNWLHHGDFKDWLLNDVDKENFICKWCGDN